MLSRRSSSLKLVSIMIIPCLCSCATIFTKYTVTLPKDIDLTMGEVKDEIPLTAGLRLSPQFRELVLIERSILVVQPTTHHCGEAFSNNCQKMLANIFQHVVLVDPPATTPPSVDIDVIVVPMWLRTGFQEKVPEGEKDAALMHQMTIKWDVTSPDGKAVYTTTILAEIPVPIGFAGSSLTKAGVEKIREKEMLDLFRVQFHKAQDDIYKNTWWKNPWWKSPN